MLWATGVFAALIPVLHDELSPPRAAMQTTMDGTMAMPAGTPVALASALIAVKVIVAMTLAAALFATAARSRRSLAQQLAGMPLLRGSALVGAATAIGLAAFDLCTRFHGADMDASGVCHCWTTAAIAAAVAFVGGVAMLWGRLVVALARRIVARIAALVLALTPNTAFPTVNRMVVAPLTRGARSALGRRLAGRAPPTSV
ncbi:MAG TPA: hypothetical protein VE591_09665 [Candidatus Acidoferrum sp.]|nr:hypothetical protein [Candidatus Acidoferrum sp.]